MGNFYVYIRFIVIIIFRSWLRLSPQGEKSGSYELHDKVVFKIGSISSFTCRRANINYLTNERRECDNVLNCSICYTNEKNVVFLPCKHNVTCSECSKNIKNCPICRKKIIEIIKIYK